MAVRSTSAVSRHSSSMHTVPPVAVAAYTMITGARPGKEVTFTRFSWRARRARATKYNSMDMSILKIARMGHPVLRVKARAIERADIRGAALQKLIDDMIETMIEYRGVGLAAPQVHESVRLFVATLGADDDEDGTGDENRDENRGDGEAEAGGPVVVINPELIPVRSEVLEHWERRLR